MDDSEIDKVTDYQNRIDKKQLDLKASRDNVLKYEK